MATTDGFFAELKRRKVLRVGAAYLVVAWLAVQAASIGFPAFGAQAFGAPAWALRVFILGLLLGFPFALVLTWMLDITPDGMRVDTSSTGDKRVIGVAIGMTGLALSWYFIGQPSVRPERWFPWTASLERALLPDPKFLRAQSQLALVQMVVKIRDPKRAAEAERHARAAMAADPSLAQPVYVLGMVLRYARRLAEARLYFDRALAIDPMLPNLCTRTAPREYVCR